MLTPCTCPAVFQNYVLGNLFIGSRMFSTRDLSVFVCKAADAVQLKFGEKKQ